jgi:hypothetical protein
MVLAVADDNGHHFGHKIEVNIKKLISTLIF